MSYNDPQPMRDGLTANVKSLTDALGSADASLEETSVDLLMRDGHRTTALVTRTRAAAGASPKPLIVLFHGGGFCAGSAEMLVRPAREFAQTFGAVVVSCTYRLSPEHKFPVHFDDAMDTIHWLSSAAGQKELGADTAAGFIIGGQSAGASLAACVLQHMQDEDVQPKATGGYICIPLVLTKDIVPAAYKEEWVSRDEHADKIPLLSHDGVAAMMEAMAADGTSPKFSPFNSKNPHRGLPQMYIQVGGQDPLRDDGLVYEKALRAAGVETRLDHYKEVGHDTWGIFSNETSPKEYEANGLAAMRWVLRRE